MPQFNRVGRLALAASSLGIAAVAAAQGHEVHARHGAMDPAGPTVRQPLAPAPKELPRWMSNPSYQEVFYKRGPYNFAVYYHLDPLARDLNGVAVGHSMAYEDLVTGRAASLETATFKRIDAVLKSPPKLMPAERFLSPKFARTYAYLEKLFDWTHVLHAQTIDALVSPKLTQEQKEREMEALWKFYKTQVPYTITGLPLNMAYLDSQHYSWAFRRKYPKVNGLFWGYHWLQTSVYDLLWKSRSLEDARRQYEVVGKRYREVELYRTDRDFMPMMAETSPEFSRRFPEMANAFDNLHMLHDMVNDILATDSLTEAQKEEQIKRAIWMVVDDPHKGEKPGDFKPGDFLHDHRFMEGQPGMGMMRLSTPKLMYMSGMGWMSMSECAHCSMPMDLDPKSGTGATVSAEGWTMEVRCVLCARDMAAQVEGRAIIRARTEDPNRPLILISDEEGNWTSNIDGVVFLEVEGPHAGCSDWSRAFTNRAAFDAFVKSQEDDEDLRNAKPLTLAEWSAKQGKEPDTYEKRKGPVENPYRPGLGDVGASPKGTTLPKFTPNGSSPLQGSLPNRSTAERLRPLAHGWSDGDYRGSEDVNGSTSVRLRKTFVVASGREKDATPAGVGRNGSSLPTVAASRQPWARGRNRSAVETGRSRVPGPEGAPPGKLFDATPSGLGDWGPTSGGLHTPSSSMAEEVRK